MITINFNIFFYFIFQTLSFSKKSNLLQPPIPQKRGEFNGIFFPNNNFNLGVLGAGPWVSRHSRAVDFEVEQG